MNRHTVSEVWEAVNMDEAFCLACGERQDLREFRLYLGLCVECDQHAVLPARDVVRALNLIEEDDDD